MVASGVQRFDGSRIYLNKLGGDGGSNDPNELTFADIIGDKTTIKAVFLSSFGCDIEWLLEHFAFGTPIVLVDDYDRKRGAMAEIQQPFGEVWSQMKIVHPYFETGGLYDSGTMHAKLIIIERAQALRVCISSSNLTPQDWEGVSQCIWVADFKAANDFEAPARKRVKPDHTSDFGDQLARFIETFFRSIPDSSSLWSYWVKVLTGSRFNVKLPKGVELIASAPGYWKGRR
ncbi:tyrosyl-dna phosphodiesterase, putative [Perkinsus marinus ATCC 50983]|uniref:Tyrosyl-dna phosphodiesterase, putative n=1 Tax=Perkinsus marinus (strain ATCC 50983 / TXsc) TaxID=423536 RepID=C5KGU1_PERM5|nr:tyrosyl-dna phosphodiesterase, putative [Perkinsus marinus ATCC 50983]EER16303.1 tyrosyl-dna phosphodiesterase, putative [Perkinsus marinus ATCC 50983]|eukprot:XP_002784507.1 tyrosyl-dna phosphodiesterase, putative [Perkinsus marinus ATCC 50983]